MQSLLGHDLFYVHCCRLYRRRFVHRLVFFVSFPSFFGPRTQLRPLAMKLERVFFQDSKAFEGVSRTQTRKTLLNLAELIEALRILNIFFISEAVTQGTSQLGSNGF